MSRTRSHVNLAHLPAYQEFKAESAPGVHGGWRTEWNKHFDQYKGNRIMSRQANRTSRHDSRVALRRGDTDEPSRMPSQSRAGWSVG